MTEKNESNLNALSGLHPDVPLNLQIYSLLRQEIEDGVWEGRTDFPGEVELAERCGVSVITSRSALDRLAKEGFISRGRGRRPMALPARRRINESDAQIMPSAGERAFTYKLLSAGLAIAPADACETFGKPAGAELWACQRLRLFQNRPHSVTLNVQLPELGEKHSKKDLQELPMANSLAKLAVVATQMKRRVGVGFPTPEVAKYLGITVQDPTLVYTFILLTEDETPIEWVRIYVHPSEQQQWEVFDLKQAKVRDTVRV